MKKSLFVTFGLIAMVAVSLAFTSNHHDPEYKNLKILPKDITEKQMDSVMHHFTASLNVRCSYCHVRREGEQHTDFASDDNKKKLRAREMMEMTNKINEKYFDLTGEKITLDTQLMITCYTCHHGATEPATKAVRQERPLLPPILSDSTKKKQ